MTPDPRALVGEARLFLDDIDFQTGQAGFVETKRASLVEAAFLDERWRGRGRRHAMPLSALVPLLGAKPATRSPSFIWHSAFCCSTLLSRAIDAEGVNLSLREPAAFGSLAEAKRSRHPVAAGAQWWPRMMATVLRLYDRPFADRESVTIKPTNFCNNLIGDAMVAMPASRSLFLYSDLRSFLISIVKKRETGRAFARRLFSTLAADSTFAADIPPRALFHMTDLQIAAAAWLMQMAAFREALARFPEARARSLDAAVFLAEPKRTLAAADRHLNLGLGAAHIESVVDSPMFARDAKDETSEFDAARRRSEASDVEAAFGASLDQIVAWADKTWPKLRPLEPLPRSLGI